MNKVQIRIFQEHEEKYSKIINSINIVARNKNLDFETRLNLAYNLVENTL